MVAKADAIHSLRVLQEQIAAVRSGPTVSHADFKQVSRASEGAVKKIFGPESREHRAVQIEALTPEQLKTIFAQKTKRAGAFMPKGPVVVELLKFPEPRLDNCYRERLDDLSGVIISMLASLSKL